MARIREFTKRSVQTIMREINRHGTKGIRAEYAELRKIANKRIARAQKTGALSDLEPFPTTKSLGSDTERIAKAMSSVLKFLSGKKSTARGRAETRAKTVKSLEKIGYDGITEKNVDLFGQFMENFKRKYELDTPEGKRLLMDSDFAVEVFDTISEHFTSKTNARSMSRMFNQYLRDEGREDLIKWL